MDSVILAFQEARAIDVIALAGELREREGDAAQRFYVEEYSHDEFISEFSQDEQRIVIHLLGGMPSSMVAVSAGRGPPSEAALKFLLACERAVGPFVIDNDRGAVLKSEDLPFRVDAVGIRCIYAIQGSVLCIAANG